MAADLKRCTMDATICLCSGGASASGEIPGEIEIVLRGTTVLPRHRGTIFLRYQYRRLYGPF